MDLEDQFFHPAMQNKNFYAGAGFLRAFEKNDLEDPFIHLAMQDKSFYARVCFPKTIKRSTRTPLALKIRLTRTPWKNGSSKSVFLRGAVEPDCPSKCVCFLSNLLFMASTCFVG